MSTNNSLKGKQALIVCSDWPWPTTYSARIDLLDRIKNLHSLGIIVDLLVTAGIHNLDVETKTLTKYIRNLMAVQRKSGFFSMLGFLKPGQVNSRKKLKNMKIENNYDYLFVEGHLVGDILENPSLSCKHKILRINNDERRYFYNLAKSKLGISSLYYLLEALRFIWYQIYLMKKSSVWLFASKDDEKIFIHQAEKYNVKSLHMPPDIQISKSFIKNDSKNVLFVGTLLVPNNLSAIKWYLKNIHPEVSKLRDYKLVVAGHSGSEKQTNDLRKFFSEFQSLEFIPSPKKLDNLYASAAIFINPMQHGAGIKLKTIHALAAGLPVVSTSIGNQGTGMRNKIDIVETDSKIEFTKAVIELLSNPIRRYDYSSSALLKLKEIYNQRKILESVLISLDS